MAAESISQPVSTPVRETEPLIPTTEKKSALSCCGMFKRVPQSELSEFEQNLRQANATRALMGFAAALCGAGILTVDVIKQGSPAWGAVGVLIALVGGAVSAGSVAANCKRSHQ